MGKQKIARELADMPIENIRPYERNPRRNDSAVGALMQSIRANGFNSPIIADENGVILAGHTRYKAAVKLGLETVPVVTVTGLGENQKRAYRIADNKIAELAKWDFAELDSELAEIDWGFLEKEAESIDWGMADGAQDEWPDLQRWDETLLGFSETEAGAIRMDADVGRMLDAFEDASPARERERRRELEETGGAGGADDSGESEDGDRVTFTARGRYQDFGEDFWKLAGELYARGVKTDTKWGNK